MQGASLLLMLNSTLTEEAFKKGVIEYLKKYTHSNTESQDFWNCFSQVGFYRIFNSSNQTLLCRLPVYLFYPPMQVPKPHDVAHMMNTWTVQKGFPLVTVNISGNQVKLTQEHFLENATDQRYLVLIGLFTLLNTPLFFEHFLTIFRYLTRYTD